MSKHRFTIDIEVDDEALATHESMALPHGPVEEWQGEDIDAALQRGIVTAIDVHFYVGRHV